MSEAVDAALGGRPDPARAATAVDETGFRDVMARFATGVAVVTCRVDGTDHAMTANSFTSVSLDPPLVLVCVDEDSRFHEAVERAATWAVSILAEHQTGRARWFATSSRPIPGQFDSTPTRRGGLSGALLLDGALATVECRAHARYPGGDHSILVGEVVGLELEDPDGRPLLWFGHGFRTLGD